jgi:hypothetical integral membrane protein (TIGR02206 family)
MAQSEPFTFAPFSVEHVLTLVLLAAIGVGLALAGRRLGASGRLRLGRALAFVLAGYVVAAYAQKWNAGELSWRYSLPLELCHFALLAALVALLRPSQLASEIAYFWGLGGTLQATVTPEIGQTFPSWEFVLFFWGHGAILLAVVYVLAARRFEPRPWSALRMLVWVNIYALVVGSIDLASGWNYGYLCQKPARSSLLDYLGPWPWYIVALEGVALVSFTLLEIPWIVRRRRRSALAAQAAGVQ